MFSSSHVPLLARNPTNGIRYLYLYQDSHFLSFCWALVHASTSKLQDLLKLRNYARLYVCDTFVIFPNSSRCINCKTFHRRQFYFVPTACRLLILACRSAIPVLIRIFYSPITPGRFWRGQTRRHRSHITSILLLTITDQPVMLDTKN